MRVFFLASVLVYQSFAFSYDKEENIKRYTGCETYVVVMERSILVEGLFEVVAHLIVLLLVLAHICEES